MWTTHRYFFEGSLSQVAAETGAEVAMERERMDDEERRALRATCILEGQAGQWVSRGERW